MDGKKKKYLMMTSKSDQFRHYYGKEFRAARIPYGDGKVGIYIFHPDRQSSFTDFYIDAGATIRRCNLWR